MRLVILESPYRGRTSEETAKNVEYAKDCMMDSLQRGESPLASHLLWPGILDDAMPADRALGIAAGLEWGRVAEATVVYVDRGISEGMVQGMNRAAIEGRIIEQRRLFSEAGKEAANAQG
jgi:hypothetical protein